jgi:ketosteroid isomerase-like protein
MQKDIETLTTLNHDFVKSVQGADVKRFDEILAKDFLFTNPDGSLYNRAEFLDLIGKGARNSELREDQVNVRLFGDFAIIHARIQYRSKAGIERTADIRMTGHGVTESGSACPRIPPARISEAAGAYCLVALALRVLEIQTACGDFPIRHHLCRHDARFHQLLVLGRRTDPMRGTR